MFANIGWGEMLVLVIAGLVILGPERLPGAIRWTSDAVRQVRDYVTGATSQLRQDLGPEFDDLREPLAELQKLRGMTPRAAITKHLLDGDDTFLTGKFDNRPVEQKPSPAVTPAEVPEALENAANTPEKPEKSAGTVFDPDAT